VGAEHESAGASIRNVTGRQGCHGHVDQTLAAGAGLGFLDRPDNMRKQAFMAWIILVVAGLLEIIWAVGLKYSEGFTKFWPSVITIVALVASFVLLAQAMRTLPVGTAYAVWTGIGAAGAALLGMFVLGEPATPARFACLALIVTGIVGLKLVS
jgi:quaternary ammonium compound-resistance protein SugE